MSAPVHDPYAASMLDAHRASSRAIKLPGEVRSAQQRAEQRERIATAAMTGLLAATPATTQATSNFDQYATRAVRYADALIEALNRSHEEAAHARRR